MIFNAYSTRLDIYCNVLTCDTDVYLDPENGPERIGVCTTWKFHAGYSGYTEGYHDNAETETGAEA